jgi:membrane protein involved in colicin uptake
MSELRESSLVLGLETNRLRVLLSQQAEALSATSLSLSREKETNASLRSAVEMAAKEKAEREAKEKAEMDAKMKAEREAKQKTEMDAKEKAVLHSQRTNGVLNYLNGLCSGNCGRSGKINVLASSKNSGKDILSTIEMGSKTYYMTNSSQNEWYKLDFKEIWVSVQG